MSQHTPGPWHVGEAPYETGIIYSEPDRTGGPMKVAECRGWGHLTGGGALGLPSDQAAQIQDANARLIAAAPQLLRACLMAREELCFGGDYEAAKRVVNAAITKATGGQL